VTAYFLRRVLASVPVMLFVAVFVFLLLRLVPGDPAQTLLGDAQAAPERIAALGLDASLPRQFLQWIAKVVRGDFGMSMMSNRPVMEVIAQRLPPTAALVAVTILLTVWIAVPLGVLAAWRHGKLVDRIVMACSVVCVSVPVFIIGYGLIETFAVRLHWFPVQGYQPLSMGLGQFVHRLTLPGLALASISVALVARMTRASMLEVLREDYVRTARAKGLGESIVLFRHALRNAAIPILTVIGTGFAMMISGVVVVETVFNIPGLGRLIVDAALARDYPLIQAMILLTAATCVVIHLLVDLSYAATDPRIRCA